ncbi:MAG: gamma-glutamyltransferase, partial [Paracoccaceae bacterium]
GGDCFALVKPAGGEQVLALNGSGVAPAAASAAALRDRGMTTVPVASADAVTVPAAMDAFCTMSDTWGRLG